MFLSNGMGEKQTNVKLKTKRYKKDNNFQTIRIKFSEIPINKRIKRTKKLENMTIT